MILAESCLSREQLQQYLEGRLSENHAADVEQHVEHCERCDASLEQLDNPSQVDSLIRTLGCSASPSMEAPDWVAPLAANAELREPTPNDAPQSADEPAAVGKQLGDYELQGVLGQGGMSIVFAAKHVHLGRDVALKVVAPGQSGLSHERFTREMRAVGALSHGAIIRATDAGQWRGTWYLVMDRIDGASVAEISRVAGLMEVADACEIARQAALGLAHAHENGIIHRDLKPSNLMVDRAGHVKLLDFGLARTAAVSGELSMQTTVGQLLGTLDYMAPEQAGRSDVTSAADVYGLGATLFKLLAGSPPHGRSLDKPVLEHLNQLANEPAPRLDTLRRDLPEPLVQLVDAMLQRDAHQRIGDCRDIAKQLAPFCDRPNLQQLAQQVVEAREGLSLSQIDHFFDSSSPSPFPPPAKKHVDAQSRAALTALTGDALRRTLAGLVAAGLFVTMLVVLIVQTDRGQLRIEADDEVPVTVRRVASGDVVGLTAKQTPDAVTLRSGKYEIRIATAADELSLSQKQVEIRRGEEVVVRINKLPKDNRAPSLDAAQTRNSRAPSTAKTKPQTARQSKTQPDLMPREAPTEPIYEGYPLSRWLAELKYETSRSRRRVAAMGIVTLARSQQQIDRRTELLSRAVPVLFATNFVMSESRQPRDILLLPDFASKLSPSPDVESHHRRVGWGEDDTLEEWSQSAIKSSPTVVVHELVPHIVSPVKEDRLAAVAAVYSIRGFWQSLDMDRESHRAAWAALHDACFKDGRDASWKSLCQVVLAACTPQPERLLNEAKLHFAKLTISAADQYDPHDVHDWLLVLHERGIQVPLELEAGWIAADAASPTSVTLHEHPRFPGGFPGGPDSFAGASLSKYSADREEVARAVIAALCSQLDAIPRNTLEDYAESIGALTTLVDAHPCETGESKAAQKTLTQVLKRCIDLRATDPSHPFVALVKPLSETLIHLTGKIPSELKEAPTAPTQMFNQLDHNARSSRGANTLPEFAYVYPYQTVRYLLKNPGTRRHVAGSKFGKFLIAYGAESAASQDEATLANVSRGLRLTLAFHSTSIASNLLSATKDMVQHPAARQSILDWVASGSPHSAVAIHLLLLIETEDKDELAQFFLKNLRHGRASYRMILCEALYQLDRERFSDEWGNSIAVSLSKLTSKDFSDFSDENTVRQVEAGNCLHYLHQTGKHWRTARLATVEWLKVLLTTQADLASTEKLPSLLKRNSTLVHVGQILFEFASSDEALRKAYLLELGKSDRITFSHSTFHRRLREIIRGPNGILPVAIVQEARSLINVHDENKNETWDKDEWLSPIQTVGDLTGKALRAANTNNDEMVTLEELALFLAKQKAASGD